MNIKKAISFVSAMIFGLMVAACSDSDDSGKNTTGPGIDDDIPSDTIPAVDNPDDSIPEITSSATEPTDSVEQSSSSVELGLPEITAKAPKIPEVTIGDITITNPLQAKAMKYLDKGMNFTNWLEDVRFMDDFMFDESDIKLIAENGVKSLRFPIDLDLYVNNKNTYAKGNVDTLDFYSARLFAVLDSFVEWTSKHNVSFVIDYHEYDNSYDATSAENPRYVTMMASVWKHVAEHYATNEREDLFYELLNEPDMSKGAVSSELWHKAAQEIIDSIRTVDTVHTIIFGDAQWYGIKALSESTPFSDNNIIYAIHTYEPFVFTHQGASWTAHKDLKNVIFPYDQEKWPLYWADFGLSNKPSESRSLLLKYNTVGSKEAILENVVKAKNWAVEHNVPVIINEFGAYNVASDKQSVLNYMIAMREISEELEIPLTHWGYTGGFALFESEPGSPKGTKLIEGMKEAYGL